MKLIGKISKKQFFIALMLCVMAAGVFMIGAQSKTKPYYLGDAVNYRGDLIVGSVNMGYLEIFQMENDNLIQKSKLESTEARFYGNENFYDLLFNEESGRLYVYAVDGRAMYKYDISNPENPDLVKKVSDNSWDWFLGIDKVGDKIATIGTNHIKIWKTNLVNIDAYEVKNKYHKNISFSDNGEYIFNLAEDKLKIYDTGLREVVGAVDLETKNNHIRKIYYDNDKEKIFVVDDEAIRKYNVDGGTAGIVNREFEHTGDFGYDVSGSDDKNHLYFSDGVGVVKLNKDTMEPIDWAYTTNMGAQGGWAMGIDVASDGASENVVVFNNSSILVLDDDMNLIDSHKAKEESKGPREKLYLSLSDKAGEPGEEIVLKGGGFQFDEKVSIEILGEDFSDTTDNDGRFKKVLQVPSALPQYTQIKVTGAESDLSYSISFSVK